MNFSRYYHTRKKREREREVEKKRKKKKTKNEIKQRVNVVLDSLKKFIALFCPLRFFFAF